MKTDLTPGRIRCFLLAHYGEILEALGLAPSSLPDDFDFLSTGVIDSLGLMQLIGAVENEFGIDIDLAALDTEYITLLGPLSRYIAENGVAKSAHTAGA
jgi:acyl carrier protein